LTLWEECKDWRRYFSWSGFATGLFIGLAPSAWDISGDYNFADGVSPHNGTSPTNDGLRLFCNQTENCNDFPLTDDHAHFISTTIYCFILFPGIVKLEQFLHILCQKYFPRKLASSACYGLLRNVNAFGLAVGIVMFMTYFGKIDHHGPLVELVAFYLSIVVAGSILLIKTMGVVLHGPEMKKLQLKTATAEGVFESAFQAMLNLIIWMVFGYLDEMNLASSVIMISKTGAENLLSDGETNKLQDLHFGQKLLVLAKYLPVMITTACFRLGSLAILRTGGPRTGYWTSFLLISVWLLLFLILLLSKCCCLTGISVFGIFQGIAAECSTITVWSKKGREDSRKIQLFVGLYLLISYTSLVCLCVFSEGFPFTIKTNAEMDSRIMLLAIVSLSCAFISFPMFIFQIYFMDKYNTIFKLRTLGMSNQG